ncbi:nucleotidyltransferase family protein [Janthinobacterium sp. LB2P10]|uniref:nucleotidyltransferase family protein n=1 Tax=Janthinobacterium sp. LB2P10 TaxID=3424194 RepID=UPI003F21B7C7
MSTVGILLAAGRGRRFDPSGVQNKLLQPLKEGPHAGLPVVVAAARNMLAALPRVLAVVRADDAQVARALGALGCEVRVCHDADTGMAASLTCAIEHVRGAPGWLIALGDMPVVEPATIVALSQAIADGARIAVPVFHGRRGNPVAFSAVYLSLLLALDGDQGARSIVNSHAVCEVRVDDSGILRDIDTPDDLSTVHGAPGRL